MNRIQKKCSQSNLGVLLLSLQKYLRDWSQIVSFVKFKTTCKNMQYQRKTHLFHSQPIYLTKAKL